MAIKEGPAEHVHLQRAHTHRHTQTANGHFRYQRLRLKKEEQPKTFPLVGALPLFVFVFTS